MKLMIEIDNSIYDICKSVRNLPLDENDIMSSLIIQSIANGKPLPKGHGRLIDADAFERRCMFDSDIEDMQDVIYALRDYKPIIEADKGDKE